MRFRVSGNSWSLFLTTGMHFRRLVPRIEYLHHLRHTAALSISMIYNPVSGAPLLSSI